MNVQALKQTSVIPTQCVITLTETTSVAVSVDIKVMVKTVQVTISLLHLFGVLYIIRQYNCKEFNKNKAFPF